MSFEVFDGEPRRRGPDERRLPVDTTRSLGGGALSEEAPLDDADAEVDPNDMDPDPEALEDSETTYEEEDVDQEESADDVESDEDDEPEADQDKETDTEDDESPVEDDETNDVFFGGDDSGLPRPRLPGRSLDDLLGWYLKNELTAPLLTAEQEVELSKRIEAGLLAEQRLADIGPGQRTRVGKVSVSREELELLAADGVKAKDTLIEANLRLVVFIAKRYIGRGVLFNDLIQEGGLGVIRAVEKFDYTKGYKFSTYATWWIRQSITRVIADQARTIRLPVYLTEVLSTLAKVTDQLTEDLGREPTPAEIAAEIDDLTPEKVVELQEHNHRTRTVSMNAPAIGKDGSTGDDLGDLIEDTEAIDPAGVSYGSPLSEVLESALDGLTLREAAIMRERFGLDDGTPKTLEEVGRLHSVTRERIRQIEKIALAKLRHPQQAEILRDYL